MAFKVHGETATHYKVEGSNGRFRIAKRGLSEATHARLRGMARGGEVDDFGQGRLPAGYKMDAGGQVPQGSDDDSTPAQQALQNAGQPNPVPPASQVGAQLGRAAWQDVAPARGSVAAQGLAAVAALVQRHPGANATFQQVYRQRLAELNGALPASPLPRTISAGGQEFPLQDTSGLNQTLGSTSGLGPLASRLTPALQAQARVFAKKYGAEAVEAAIARFLPATEREATSTLGDLAGAGREVAREKVREAALGAATQRQGDD